MKKKQNNLEQKMAMFEPDDSTISEYKEIETHSVAKLKKFLKGEEGEAFNEVSLRILNQVNRVRSSLKNQMAIRVGIWKNMSEDKKEFKQYIKVSYPQMKRKK